MLAELPTGREVCTKSAKLSNGVVYESNRLCSTSVISPMPNSSFADYYETLIVPLSDNSNIFYDFQNEAGICFDQGRVIPPSTRLTRILNSTLGDGGTDLEGRLSVVFGAEESVINNRFDVIRPLCFAFIANAIDTTTDEVLMYTNSGPLITFVSGTSVRFSLHGNTVSFNLPNPPSVRGGDHRRLQICIDGTEAVFYSECQQISRQQFVVLNPQPVTYVSVLVDVFQGDPVEVSLLYTVDREIFAELYFHA